MLSEKHLKGIEARSISAETAIKFGLYSGKRYRDGLGEDAQTKVDPDENGDTLCFPFIEHDEHGELNTKYRWSVNGERRFMQRKGSVKTLFNARVLFDPEMMHEMEEGTHSLIWTEGEFDCMAVDESGFPYVVSLPDGAMPGRDNRGRLIEVPDDTSDIDDQDDDKFAFMARLGDQINSVKYHIIAFDGDDSGRRMTKEIVRRIGPARCYWVEYPEEKVVKDKKTKVLRACKDMNEVKQHLGNAAVRDLIERAKPWPVKGLFDYDDYPEMEIPVMHDIGISDEMDEHIKLYTPSFVVMTGTPGVGKSTLANQIFVRMAKVHKWPITLFSGEKAVKPFLGEELITAFLGKAKEDWTRTDREEGHDFVQRYFSFIDYDQRLNDEQDIDLDFVLDRAATSVFRRGTKLLGIDPWNELEHNRAGVSLTEYTGSAIRKLKRFGFSFDCCVWVVAHPTKLGPGEIPSLYSVSDSAHWANKADLGIIVHAESPTDEQRSVIVPKVRLRRIAGNVGDFTLEYDNDTSLFGGAMKVPF